jgi:hypothetical protein
MPAITQELPENRTAKVHVPRAKIAVLRHDAETAHTPSYDLGALPAIRDDRWDVLWFDDDSYGGMLGQPSPFSALVLGYNAVSFTEDVRVALSESPPADPIVLLHQLRPNCYEFLRESTSTPPGSPTSARRTTRSCCASRASPAPPAGASRRRRSAGSRSSRGARGGSSSRRVTARAASPSSSARPTSSSSASSRAACCSSRATRSTRPSSRTCSRTPRTGGRRSR